MEAFNVANRSHLFVTVYVPCLYFCVVVFNVNGVVKFLDQFFQ